MLEGVVAETQFDALQIKLAALTEKIDSLQGSSTTVVTQRRSENLPRDMVVSIKVFVADFHAGSGKGGCKVVAIVLGET